MAFPRFIKVSVSRILDGPALVVGSGLCRCDPGTQHQYGADVFGVVGNCPIKKMLVQADAMIASFPGNHGQVRVESGGATIRFSSR